MYDNSVGLQCRSFIYQRQSRQSAIINGACM